MKHSKKAQKGMSATVAFMLIVMAAIPAKNIVAVLIGLLLAFDSRQQDAESPVRSRKQHAYSISKTAV